MILERRRRIDEALFTVVMEAYVHGVSTRKVDDLVAAAGVAAGISKSEVSSICSRLDEQMAAWRARRLDHVEFPYLFADATSPWDASTTRSCPAPSSWSPASP